MVIFMSKFSYNRVPLHSFRPWSLFRTWDTRNRVACYSTLDQAAGSGRGLMGTGTLYLLRTRNIPVDPSRVYRDAGRAWKNDLGRPFFLLGG